jgi:hypothetical protein
VTNLLERSSIRRTLSEQRISFPGRTGDITYFHPSEYKGTMLSDESLVYKEPVEQHVPFTVVVDEPAPAWHYIVAEQLNELAHLTRGWNGRLSRPLDVKVVDLAITILEATMREDTPAPALIPANDGSIQLEWHRGGIDLEVSVGLSGELDLAFDDVHDPASDWGDVSTRDLTSLSQALARLTERAPASV